ELGLGGGSPRVVLLIRNFHGTSSCPDGKTILACKLSVTSSCPRRNLLTSTNGRPRHAPWSGRRQAIMGASRLPGREEAAHTRRARQDAQGRQRTLTAARLPRYHRREPSAALHADRRRPGRRVQESPTSHVARAE